MFGNLGDFLLLMIFIVVTMVALISLGSLLTWVERKLAALVSDRIGANRAYVKIPFFDIKIVAMGLIHIVTDGLKLVSKERFTPRLFDAFAYQIAPWIVFSSVLLTFSFVPFGGKIETARLFADYPALLQFFQAKTYLMQIVPIDGGTLAILAISGLGIIGVILAGWSSNNKYSLLGGVRAASQMISYEITLGLSLLPMVLIYGSINLYEMVEYQGGTIFGFLPAWGIFLCPPAAVLYLISAIAENKRVPFDLPEAESELIAGHFTEYSGMKMGLFMFAEFIEIVVISGIFVTFFLGGNQLPYMTSKGILLPWMDKPFLFPHLLEIVCWPLLFYAKIFLVCCFQILIRWSLPRFRYDQLLTLGWKILIPFGLITITIVTFVLWILEI